MNKPDYYDCFFLKKELTQNPLRLKSWSWWRCKTRQWRAQLLPKITSNTKVLHVESRNSFWRFNNAEEINRMVTDSITDYFFHNLNFSIWNLLKFGAIRKCSFCWKRYDRYLYQNLGRISAPDFWNEYQLKREKKLYRSYLASSGKCERRNFSCQGTS